MSSPVGRIAEFTLVAQPELKSNADTLRMLQRIDVLTIVAFRLGATEGCRVTDDVRGLDFRWRWAPNP